MALVVVKRTDKSEYRKLETDDSGNLYVKVSGEVTVGTNNDKTGYQIDGTKTRLDDLNDFDSSSDKVEIAGTKNRLDDMNDLSQADILSDGTPFQGGDIQSIYDHIGSDTVDTNNYGLFPNGNAWAMVTFLGVPSDGETFTVGGVTYTFRTVLTVPPVANEVLIGVSMDECARNLTQAIVGDPNGEGTNYSTGTTAHPDVTAYRDMNLAPEILRVYAIHGGTGGNSIGISTTSGNIDLGGFSFLVQGADSSHTGMMITGISTANTFQSEWDTLVPPNLVSVSFAMELLIEQLGHSSPIATHFVMALAYGYEENETEFYRIVLGDFDSSVSNSRYSFPERIEVPLKNIPGNSRISCKITSDTGGGNPMVTASVQLKPNSS